MLDYPVVLTVSVVVVVLVGIVVAITVGIIPAVSVFIIAAFILYLLHMFGKFDLSLEGDGLHFDFHENAPSAKGQTETQPHIKEVFHIDNRVIYDEAAAVCAAYDSEIASFDQVQEAFSLGAEWCSYGWSLGGMALFPTQQSTWFSLQQESQDAKRTACGRPGVNGGYFDPNLKFGVNCYGVKPRNHGTKFPQPLPTGDSRVFDELVRKFRSMLPMKLSGFNRDVWSEKSVL